MAAIRRGGRFGGHAAIRASIAPYLKAAMGGTAGSLDAV